MGTQVIVQLSPSVGGPHPRPLPKREGSLTLAYDWLPSLLGRGRGWSCAARAILLLLLLPHLALAQTFPRRAPDLDRLAQELFAEIQSDQVPYEDLYNTLLQYYQSPLNLNTAGREELRSLPLLSEKQVTALVQYRRDQGPLLSVYELQAVPGWDVRTIERVAPLRDYRGRQCQRGAG